MATLGTRRAPVVEWPEPVENCSVGDFGVAKDIRVPRHGIIRASGTGLGRTPVTTEVELELVNGRYAIVSVRAVNGVLAASIADELFILPRDPERALEAAIRKVGKFRLPDMTEHYTSWIDFARAVQEERGILASQRYRLAAVSYCLAYLVGLPPTQAVAEDFGVGPGAAAQLVRRARQLGYLPPTTRGKARA